MVGCQVDEVVESIGVVEIEDFDLDGEMVEEFIEGCDEVGEVCLRDGGVVDESVGDEVFRREDVVEFEVSEEVVGIFVFVDVLIVDVVDGL